MKVHFDQVISLHSILIIYLGQAIINSGATTWSDRTNVVIDLPNPTRMPPASYPEATDGETSIQNPALPETTIARPLNSLASKVATPLGSGDESSEEGLIT